MGGRGGRGRTSDWGGWWIWWGEGRCGRGGSGRPCCVGKGGGWVEMDSAGHVRELDWVVRGIIVGSVTGLINSEL